MSTYRTDDWDGSFFLQYSSRPLKGRAPRREDTSLPPSLLLVAQLTETVERFFRHAIFFETVERACFKGWDEFCTNDYLLPE
jgi:hypothetical protein